MLIVFKWLFVLLHLLSIQLYHIQWTLKTPQKFKLRLVRHTNIYMIIFQYLCRCLLSSQSKSVYEALCEIQLTHHITFQIEQKAQSLVSSLATAHPVEDNERIWTWSTGSAVCSVSATVHSSSIWHNLTFLYPYTVGDISFYCSPCWHW